MATKKEEGGAEAATVTVKVTGQALCEAGVSYKAGDTFETTPERASALGGFVEKVG